MAAIYHSRATVVTYGDGRRCGLADEGHGQVGPKQERWQKRRQVGKRQDVRMQLDAQRAAHERATRLSPGPRLRGGGLEGIAQRAVGQRDAVLDIRGEVVRSGGRDDVDLE